MTRKDSCLSLENGCHLPIHLWPARLQSHVARPVVGPVFRKMEFSAWTDNKQVLIAAVVIIKIYLVNMASLVNKSCR